MADLVKQELLDQLAEHTKRDAIKDLQTKSGMLASLLVVGSAQLYIGSTALRTGLSCVQHLHWWLAADGAATSAGMLIGWAALNKGIQVAHRVEMRQWLLPDGKERDIMSELTGVWRRAHQLSDVMDVGLVLSFLWGCYYCATSSGGGSLVHPGVCQTQLATGRSWVLRALILKPLAPISVTVAFKGWHSFWGTSPPAQAQVHEQKRE